jgi:ATP-binding cassette subfamily B protein
MIGHEPGLLRKIMTGEVLSRITTDTTLMLSVIVLVGLDRAAQPPDPVGGLLMLLTSPS